MGPHQSFPRPLPSSPILSSPSSSLPRPLLLPSWCLASDVSLAPLRSGRYLYLAIPAPWRIVSSLSLTCSLYAILKLLQEGKGAPGQTPLPYRVATILLHLPAL